MGKQCVAAVKQGNKILERLNVILQIGQKKL